MKGSNAQARATQTQHICNINSHLNQLQTVYYNVATTSENNVSFFEFKSRFLLIMINRARLFFLFLLFGTMKMSAKFLKLLLLQLIPSFHQWIWRSDGRSESSRNASLMSKNCWNSEIKISRQQYNHIQFTKGTQRRVFIINLSPVNWVKERISVRAEKISKFWSHHCVSILLKCKTYVV